VKPKLLIVDDDEEIRSQMKWALTSSYEVTLAEDRPSALARFQEHRTLVVLLDLGLPPNPGDAKEGLEILTELLGRAPSAKIIIITGQNEKQTALQAISRGAYDFLAKPVEMDELKVILKRAFQVALLEQELKKLKAAQPPDSFEGMLGSSPEMQGVFSSIRKVATTDAPVLVLGESGTGKEMAALAIHNRSPRRSGPFVPINCGAIPETLLESELFGHEKGAFTGAHVQRQGRIESASGGTLFLDEIGELPPALQVKLLRFLQEQRTERVGGRREITIDTRLIAATNTDLTKAMTDNQFREDLYYRLAVVVLQLPPLRDRKNDIRVLAQAFVQKFAREFKKKVSRFNHNAWRALENHPWPGNIRELENRVKRAVIMAEGPVLTDETLELADATATPRSLKEAREDLEREMVLQALRRHNGKITPAAADLGISRPTLYELMEKLKIQRE
jgi:two-component system NtrC family response regulator